MKNVIHQYFKKEIDDHIILVQINPYTLKGMELIISPAKQIKKTERIFDPGINEDLIADGFLSCSPLEFNLFLKGIISR